MSNPANALAAERELTSGRYELDLLMDGAFGYNLAGSMGEILGSLFVSKLVER